MKFAVPVLVLVALAAPAFCADDWPTLSWSDTRDLEAVKNVFTHASDPAIAFLATEAGLLKTVDDGQSWQPLASATAEKVGLVTSLTVSLADEKTIVIGTNANGMFISRDGGASFSPIGAGPDKPAANHVEQVSFYPADPSWQTLHASHGVAAAGMSVSRDLGATWEVVGADRFFKAFASWGDNFVAVGSMTLTEGKSWGLHGSATDAIRWEECNRGIRPTDVVLTPLGPRRYFVATLDGAILQSLDDGQTWLNAIDNDGASWASMFTTMGRTDSAEILAAYDPRRQGVVLSPRRFANGTRTQQNQGLYVAPLVKSGAVCRANANGSTYYIIMNNTLWTGRRALPKTGPAFMQARCVPSTIAVGHAALSQAQTGLKDRISALAGGSGGTADVRAIAGAVKSIQDQSATMVFSLQVKVRPGDKPIKSVTVDTVPLGGSGSVALFDDGKHNDGAAGDNLWAADVSFTLNAFADAPHDRRRRLPGLAALTVTVTDQAGASDGWTATVAITQRPEPIQLFPGAGIGGALTSGQASVQQAHDEGVAPRTPALCFAGSAPGPWRAGFLEFRGQFLMFGRRWLDFQIKGDTNQDVRVHLVDHHMHGTDNVDEPHYSAGVPLIAGGYLKSITPSYQKVRVPVSALLPKGTFFLQAHGSGLALSVPEGGKPGKYYLDQVVLEP